MPFGSAFANTYLESQQAQMQKALAIANQVLAERRMAYQQQQDANENAYRQQQLGESQRWHDLEVERFNEDRQARKQAQAQADQDRDEERQRKAETEQIRHYFDALKSGQTQGQALQFLSPAAAKRITEAGTAIGQQQRESERGQKVAQGEANFPANFAEQLQQTPTLPGLASPFGPVVAAAQAFGQSMAPAAQVQPYTPQEFLQEPSPEFARKEALTQSLIGHRGQLEEMARQNLLARQASIEETKKRTAIAQAHLDLDRDYAGIRSANAKKSGALMDERLKQMQELGPLSVELRQANIEHLKQLDTLGVQREDRLQRNLQARLGPQMKAKLDDLRARSLAAGGKILAARKQLEDLGKQRSQLVGMPDYATNPALQAGADRLQRQAELIANDLPRLQQYQGILDHMAGQWEQDLKDNKIIAAGASQPLPRAALPAPRRRPGAGTALGAFLNRLHR